MAAHTHSRLILPRPLLFVLLTLPFACRRSQPFPLTDLGGVTRIEVRNRIDADSAHVIRDPTRISKVVATLRATASGWGRSPVTLPAGDVAAVFYRDTTVVGVVWLGKNYMVARGSDGALIRSSGPEELARLAVALELPVKVIRVPPRGTT